MAAFRLFEVPSLRLSISDLTRCAQSSMGSCIGLAERHEGADGTAQRPLQATLQVSPANPKSYKGIKGIGGGPTGVSQAGGKIRLLGFKKRVACSEGWK